MIYIDKAQHIIDANQIHKDNLMDTIISKKESCGDKAIIDFLTDEKIESILTSGPKELYEIHLSFISSVLKSSSKEFSDYLEIKKKTSKTPSETEINDKYTDSFVLVKKIFNYSAFARKGSRYSAYNLAENLDIPICPYCNRIYTKTVSKPLKITRPTFDHWFPQSFFPLLALSFYNLIPSCNVCNSSVKGSKIFDIERHFHPYYIHTEKDKIINYSFSFEHKDYANFKFKIIDHNKFSKESIKASKLKEIYETHEDEIKDLIRLKDIYSYTYLETLRNHVLKDTSATQDEIYRLAFGTYIEEARFDRRPLSKMKKDILIELNIIKCNDEI